MTDTIMRQQLELHFGDEFPTVYANTRSYIKGLIAKPWWVDRMAMINSEGPLPRMVEDALCHIIDKGEKKLGWASYTSYLSSFYGSSMPDAKSVRGWKEYLESDVTWTSNDSAPPLSEAETSVEANVSDLLDEEQAADLYLIDKVGPTRAAEYLNLSPEQTLNRRRTLRRTALRRHSG